MGLCVCMRLCVCVNSSQVKRPEATKYFVGDLGVQGSLLPKKFFPNGFSPPRFKKGLGGGGEGRGGGQTT